MVFMNTLWLSFCDGNSKRKFLFASIKSLPNCENPSSNPLQEAFYGFPIAAWSMVKYGVRSPKFIWTPCAQLYCYWSAKIDYISL